MRMLFCFMLLWVNLANAGELFYLQQKETNRVYGPWKLEPGQKDFINHKLVVDTNKEFRIESFVRGDRKELWTLSNYKQCYNSH